MKVSDVMTLNVSTLTENSSVREAAIQMNNLNVGSLPVCDNNNHPIGMVTDRDIVIRNVSQGGAVNSSIKEVMTSKIISVTADTDIHEAARIMAQNQIRRLPVVENGKVMGILSIGDLAVRDIYVNEAGEALSQISEPTKSMR